MKKPDWANCDEEELWQYVAWHLEGADIETVLVGGAVVAVYTEGLYRSGDLDLVAHHSDRQRIGAVLEEIGFESTKSRYFQHPDCSHLLLEFPPGPVELGNEFPVEPVKRVVEGREIHILSPTDCAKDRLAGYIHWGSRDLLDQAALVCQRQPARIDWDNLKRWCQNEGGSSQFKELEELVGRG